MWVWIILAIPMYLLIAGALHSLVIRFNLCDNWEEDGQIVMCIFWPFVIPAIVIGSVIVIPLYGLTRLIGIISKLMLGEYRLADRYKSRRRT
jgi:hypothetical protein